MLRAKDFRAEALAALTGQWGYAILFCLLVDVLLGSSGSFTAGFMILVLTGPLTVGLAGVFLRFIRRQKADVIDLFDGFKNFVNTMIGGLLYSLFLVLWGMLFIIPGIIKSYSYAMTFFIMSDNPEIDGMEAITQSRKMMDGNKWRLFCLDFSFIGWLLLSILTCGVLYIVYVGPYMQAAHAAFYQSIKPAPAVDAETPVSEAAPAEGGTENI